MKDLYQEEKAWAADMTQTEGKLKKAEKPHKYEQIITVSFNKEHNGIELSFRFKPNATERAKLKRAGFKWHYKKMVWYATNNADRWAAIAVLNGTIKYPDDFTPEKVKSLDKKRENIHHQVELLKYMEEHPVYDAETLKVMDLTWEEYNELDSDTAYQIYKAALEKMYSEENPAA